MDVSLIATKVQIPSQSPHVLPRVRLTDALEIGVPRHKLTVLSTPAGYGKTTLLAQWARSSRLQVAWLSLGEKDSDLERFFRYLFSAWEGVQPAVGESSLGLLLTSNRLASDTVLNTLINVANDIPERLAFVFDDFHLIEDPSIHEALSFLLEHLPPTVHVVLSGRAEPPLPLARYRARSELLEFRADELRFSAEETKAFLNQRLEPGLGRDEITLLHGQLEGWAAGLQLASLTLPRCAAGDELTLSGRHRFITDYLNEEVLASLPIDVRRFLLQTSVLDSMCASLCDAVTGVEERGEREESESQNSQEMLERLERDNLFLMPLDNSRTWFRYHRLFAEVLREALSCHYPDDVAGLHRRAARWYLSRGLPDEALRHAVLADDLELGSEIVERYFETMLLKGEFKLLTRWLKSLPERWYVDYPSLGLVRAGTFLFTGAFEAGIRCVDEVEAVLLPAEGEEARWHLARVTALRCTIACFKNDLKKAEDLAERAFRSLGADDHTFRSAIQHSLGDTYRRNGRWEQARSRYQKVLELTRAPSFHIRSVHALGGLADTEMRQGRLRAAASCWREALARLEQEPRGSFPLPLMGWLHIRLAEVLYEWDELEEAEGYLTEGLRRAELGGDARVLITAFVTLGRLKRTLGDLAGANDYLERARPLVESSPDPEWRARFDRFQLELWLAQDKLRTAVSWADERLSDEEKASRPGHDLVRLTLAHILIVRGDAPALERALTLLKSVLEPAEAEGRLGDQLEALTVLALARWRRGDRARALTTLARALRLAEPEGYLRRFADLGLPLVSLLQEAESREVMPHYVERLLAACASSPLMHAAPQKLPEPLTHREREVLELVAAGLTNSEVAEQLAIAPGTVKKHTGNIYGKLGAKNRTEAAARARELNWLD